MLVGETDSREAGEFFSTYLSSDVLTSPVMWIVLLILAHVVIGLRKPVCRLLGIDYRKFRTAQLRFPPILSSLHALSGVWRARHGAARVELRHELEQQERAGTIDDRQLGGGHRAYPHQPRPRQYLFAYLPAHVLDVQQPSGFSAGREMCGGVEACEGRLLLFPFADDRTYHR